MSESWRELGEIADRFLACFTYKPGWSFEVERKNSMLPYSGPWVDLYLVIRMDVEDANHPGQNCKVGARYLIPDYVIQAEGPERVFMEQVRRWIWEMERHEMDEWFRIDGAMPFDPHRKRELPQIA
jgi:hypothetical protein